MSHLLTDPDVVVVVGGAPSSRAAARSAVRDGAASDVLAVDGLDALGETLAARDDVGCVVALSADRFATVRETVREADYGGGLPVVAYVDDPAVAATVARHDACRYLPRSADDDDLVAVVDDALAAYETRRREAAESGLFRTLLADGDLSIFVKDREGRHLYKADLDDGHVPEEVVGKTDVDLNDGAGLETAEDALADDLAVVETGDPIYRKEEDYDLGNGNTLWEEVTKVPWRVDGEVRGLVGFSTPINRRKRFEQRLEEQSDRIDQFISYVSHDLRTPLQIIYGGIERARAGDEDALDSIEEATDRLGEIVDDLGTLSKGETDSRLSSSTLQTLNAESLTTDVVPLVEELWSVVAPESADIRIEMPRETVVGAGTETVRPVLENLLKNAVDHAGPDVTVEVGATENRGVYVADDGPGIPESEREKVTDVGYTTAEDGTGTGLDIVSQTVRQQGWDLTIDDADLGGARFAIEGLPTVTRTEFEVTPRRELALTDNADVGPVRIPGSAEYDPERDRWTVVADGQNVWGDTHEFHSVHGEGTAPVRIQGRIVGIDGVSEYSKAGLAVRAGLDERAPFGYVGTTESHGSEVTWREAVDGFTDSDQFEELPETFGWYRVDYVDGIVTCYLSEAGDDWHPVDQRALDLGETVSVGIMACSHSGKQTCEATFEQVSAFELDVE